MFTCSRLATWFFEKSVRNCVSFWPLFLSLLYNTYYVVRVLSMNLVRSVRKVSYRDISGCFTEVCNTCSE